MIRVRRVYRLGFLGAVLLFFTIWHFIGQVDQSGDDMTYLEYRLEQYEKVQQDMKIKGNRRDLASEIKDNVPHTNLMQHPKGKKDEENFMFIKSKESPGKQLKAEAKNNSILSYRTGLKNDSLRRTGASELIKKAILDINHNQEIQNIKKYPMRSESSVVIVVMVHKRLEYLQYLIESLRRADQIEDALLIFSHDFYSEEVNEKIRAIDFCQTMQIFYPYSLQIYQNEFPGPEANDCPRDISRAAAREMKCNNWEHPDTYGHYREVQFVMTKHHWFWKLQHVFTGLSATRDHRGLVLLIEEDHYVAPDFYVMLKKMYDVQKKDCPECNILCLGTYDKNRVYNGRADKADMLEWHSSKHNMGMALDRSTWEHLQDCREQFCNYDDYNWDWTLQHISHMCLKPPLVAMVLKSPRIFHIGECGIHHNGKCNAKDLVGQIDSALKTNAHFLFPSNVILGGRSRSLRVKQPKPNGGWGDVRDHALCATYGTTNKRRRLLL